MAGLAGGLINPFLADPKTERVLPWWQHILVGTGAAFIVPVFLNTISSRLIADITGPELSAEVFSKLLLLGGICLLAAISSRAFIKSMTDKILKEVSSARREAEDAKQVAKNAEALAEAAATPEPESEELGQSAVARSVAPPLPPTGITLSEVERKILKALVNTKYALRSLSGIAKDSSLSIHQVNGTLGSLFTKALIVESKNKEG